MDETTKENAPSDENLTEESVDSTDVTENSVKMVSADDLSPQNAMVSLENIVQGKFDVQNHHFDLISTIFLIKSNCSRNA